MISRSIIIGFAATFALLGIFTLVVSALSGSDGLKQQFEQYWQYLLLLAIGFGLQVALTVHLRAVSRLMASQKLLVANGATSTTAMISCCTHYVVQAVPFLGIGGLAAFVGQYQTQIFLVGIAANMLGIVLLCRKIFFINNESVYAH